MELELVKPGEAIHVIEPRHVQHYDRVFNNAGIATL
jgi:hypothetical protein